MTRDAVASELGSAYGLEELSPTFFLVQTTRAPKRVIGSVSFQDGKLSAIQKRWGDIGTGQQGTEFAEGVYQAILSLIPASCDNCRIEVGQSVQPDQSTKRVRIRNGAKYVDLVVSSVTGYGTTASVEEVLK